MTTLSRPIRRELVDPVDRRAIVVKVAREGIYVKEKGQRWASAWLCPWGAVYSVAGKLAARQLVAERKARRLARRRAS